jgi:hypothetical protein
MYIATELCLLCACQILPPTFVSIFLTLLFPLPPIPINNNSSTGQRENKERPKIIWLCDEREKKKRIVSVYVVPFEK